MGELIADFQQRAVWFAAMISILTPLEFAFSHERHSVWGRVRGIAYWVAWTICAMAAAKLFVLISPSPLLRIPVSAQWVGAWDFIVAPVLAAIVSDFYFYFHHRIQHAVPLLWRFHAVHHSIRELNAVNAYHHPLDEFIKGFISLVPLTLFAVDVGRAIFPMAIILALHPYYLHSPVKLHLGWLRHIFGDNRFHRIHHSLEPRHFGKNYGAFTTLWDRLFGTAYWPAKNEWPKVGLADVDEPDSLKEWISLPWRFRPESPSQTRYNWPRRWR